ncbi:MAG: DUF4411 family protein [Dehalococcoidales bacterium]|nr:DUF4411 family protein [Dehalococcoidales bacterium]
MEYSLDSSAIIETWVRGFPPELFPLVWSKLEELIQNEVLRASEEVLIELEKKDDRVYQWAMQRPHMFLPSTVPIQRCVKDILAQYPRLIDTRKNRSGADPFVIAVAMLHGCAVISEENPTYSMNRPKIPDVCAGLGIRCLNMLQLFREQGWVFE